MASESEQVNITRFVSMGLLVIALLYCAAINLFSDFKPVVAANDKLATELNQSSTFQLPQKMQSYIQLLQQQKELLLKNPIEPYAWMRLSFLRKNVLSDRIAAFDALRFADKIAQPDNVGGFERILMWREYKDLHTEEDKTREVDMWRKAYRTDWENIYPLLDKYKLHHVFDMAIEGDPELLARLNKTRKH